MLWLLKNCRKCSGDLILDGDEWRCWQCGQYYYPMSESPDMLEEPPNPEMVSAGGEGVLGEARNRVRRSHRHLNSRIIARDRSDNRWWDRNRDVVKYLGQGLSVSEISGLVSHGERQVWIIRERLHDLRINNPEGELLAAVS